MVARYKQLAEFQGHVLPAHLADRLTLDGECWVLLGGLTGGGYTLIEYKAKRWPGHVLVYTLLVGRVGEGLELDHLCRNRRCCNPAHLEAVTHQENVRRGIVARTGYDPAGELCPNGHSWATEARSYPRRGVGQNNFCHACALARKKRYRQKLKLAAAAGAASAALLGAGSVSANANAADADCSGVTFTMPRGETDTVVTTTLDGRVVRTDVITTFGASLAFSIPSPDQSRPHVWSITVDSRWNADTAWSEQVPACIAPTTSTTTSTTVAVTTPPVPTTVPPVVSSTVVTPPRTPVTTVPEVTTTTVSFALPETGSAGPKVKLPLFLGAWLLGIGIGARTLARRK